ncbi:kinesin-like protein KIN-14I isoform X2 [Cucurbita moschata]|uniref:Kinesin-like protein KIN-14I isoform X2 n=1 Tax=Cucurbita moschata TaxID=3662 RepID=A0A6J1F4J6_CUCMO|nr:kinesin-like protein KIN-14I isoform X2 [Cucurbita moschata]XP_022935411.1 kinesin-like protein KIN-14I isoform X2 [Cucurbita moschata]
MERTLSFSVASVVEDVLQQHGNRLGNGGGGLDLESRRAEEAASRRNEAAGWLRKMIGVVAAKDLPAEPSEEEFRLGLRSGIILCNVLNKVQPGAVPKVVESPCDSALIPDGAALSAFQYFENVRNFLVAVQDMGVPTFEASDLEQGGKSARVVNTVLALKSYDEWKQGGGYGVWKFGGNVKPTTTLSATKSFVRKNSEPFTNSLSRTSSLNDKSFNSSNAEWNKTQTSSRSMLVRALLTDKRPEEIPTLVESLLSKLVDEVENRFSSLEQSCSKDVVAATSQSNKSLLKSAFGAKRADELHSKEMEKNEIIHENSMFEQQSKSLLLKQQMIFDQQQKDVQELKHKLHATKAGMQFMQVKFNEEFHNLGMHVHSLAHAASGYHKVLEDNRKLYNQVQDLKGSIRVYCRVRPFLSGQSNGLSVVDHIEDGNITVNAPSKHGKGQRSFGFNKVFGPSATQVEVFADMQPLVRSVLDGYNVCIFAYGQTGSGKTFTMTGPKELTEKSQGVNYRALGDLFLIADQRKETYRYDVSVQMIEIYNEQVRDLLVTDGTNKRLEIRNSSQNGLSVPDANLVSVSSTLDIINLMNLGHRNRVVGATALNDRSSRSHSCLTVHVQGRDLTSGAILRGCMHLVDLAGSERVDKSEVTGDRLKEAQHINKSLSALGDVIASLAQKNPHVPYRNSKLTQLLQDSLGGQAKTLMFVHISPEPDAIGETLSTLKFAERVATVELGAARVNKDTSDVKELKEQIASLKAALARKEGAQQQHAQHSASGNEKFKTKASEISPFRPKSQDVDVLVEHAIRRQPMGDVGNIELHNNSALRQKRQSFDMDELLANSPPWPPVSSPCLNYREDDKDTASGEWVDKVMVNKQDVNRIENPLGGCWETENGHLNDVFHQKYLQDSSKLYTEQGFSMLTGANRFNLVGIDDIDDIDAGTSDSSEPDLLWQFNHSKLTSIGSGIGSKTKKPNGGKAVKSPELRNLSSSMGPSPSQKISNGVGALPMNRNGRQPASAENKRRTGNRKQ